MRDKILITSFNCNYVECNCGKKHMFTEGKYTHELTICPDCGSTFNSKGELLFVMPLGESSSFSTEESSSLSK